MRKLQRRVSQTVTVLVLVLLVAVSGTGWAQTYSVLYNFMTGSGEPQLGPSSFAQGRSGDLYSTASSDGANGLGTVYKITLEGNLTVLYNFDNAHGAVPNGGLVLGTDGNFYGTTYLGGTNADGTVFKIAPSGPLSVLYSFTGGADGFYPVAAPVEGTDGSFYGTTVLGGNFNACSPNGCGTLYKITRSGAFTTLYQFDYTHGNGPIAALIQGVDGNLYGTTQSGGTNGRGTAFKITHTGKLTVIHNFAKSSSEEVEAPLFQCSDGDFYGTSLAGGTARAGTVFRMSSHGKLKVLHYFKKSDGSAPYAGLVQATDGNFYGSTGNGGTFGYGVLYRITPQGGFSVLHNFDKAAGATPIGAMLQHTNGILYGVTSRGGTDNGVFYSLDAGLGPFVSFLPASGKVGKTIEFLGQGLTGTTAVSFNGTPATFAVESDTYLTATVPDGATSGPVIVTTPGGPLTSNKAFHVTP